MTTAVSFTSAALADIPTKIDHVSSAPVFIAQEIPEIPRSTINTLPGDTLDNVFDRAFFHETGRFYEITDIFGQANQIFGWRTFPGSFFENQISSDGLTVNTVYRDAMRQQTAGPRMVTRDLPSPFNTSLQDNPDYLRSNNPQPAPPIIPQNFPIYEPPQELPVQGLY